MGKIDHLAHSIKSLSKARRFGEFSGVASSSRDGIIPEDKKGGKR
jgi:hypothetical protein